MIRIGICDDNINMLQNLKNVVHTSFAAYPVEFEITTYTNGQLVVNAHRIEKFDILFLDIDMPGINGFDVAKSLRDDYINCFIIFVTSYSELVFESMNFLPFNFIRKNCSIPIEESVRLTTAKLIKYMRQNEKLLLKDEKNCDFDIYIRDIAFISNDKHYVKYHTIKHPTGLRARGLITELEQKLIDYDFVKIHKSYLVNLRYLSRVDKKNDEIYIREMDKKLPMSKNYKKEVLEKYMHYLRTRS